MNAEVSERRSLLRRWYRRALPLLVFLLVYFLVLVYPPLRIGTLAWPAWQPDTLVLALLMAGPAAGRLACERLSGWPARLLGAVVMTWLGITFVGLCVLVPWELAALVLPLPAQASGFTLLGITAALAVAGIANAQHLHRRIVEVPAPAAVHGLTLVQLTDVHIGSRSGRFLRRVVRAANRARPDLVLITGDLVDFRNVASDTLAPLAELAAPAYYVIGNHERYVDCDAICRRLGELGVTVLRNRSVQVGPLQLVGIDDAEPRSQVGRVLERLTAQPDAYRILLYHRPSGVEDAARWGIQLMLCGHTHYGQIVPFNQIVRRVFPRIRGLYTVGDLRLYVSPGTGTWGPLLRLGSRCEVSVLRLLSSETQPGQEPVEPIELQHGAGQRGHERAPAGEVE